MCVCARVCAGVYVPTLPCHDEAGHAVWNTGARRQEGDAHDDIRDAQGKPNHSHLKQQIPTHMKTSDG